MGTGNYSHSDGETVTLNLYDGIYEEAKDDEDLMQILSREAFSDFQEDLRTILAKTTFDMDGNTWRSDDRNCLILAENDLYQIWSHEDSYGHVFVTYGISERIADNLEPLARHHLVERAEAFFDMLQEIYIVHVATSAWTSTLREMSHQKAA